MRLVAIACFLNEEAYLPTFLESVSDQTRAPDLLLLVDDGSHDGSVDLARQFAAEHSFARALTRPRRPAERDRLATAAELAAFTWAAEQVAEPWDVIAKLDADMRLSPHTVAEVIEHLEADQSLGITGPLQSMAGDDGVIFREHVRPDHVRGATKFYRRECFEQIFPLPPRLGWDTLDEIRARMHGWRTGSFATSDSDPIHLRPTSTHDGALRGYRREGIATYAYGAGPWWVLLGTVRRLGSRPLVLRGLAFMLGWLTAAIRRDPRASANERAFLSAEHRARLRADLSRS